eukprot:3544686-Amphidinium_carterae.1
MYPTVASIWSIQSGLLVDVINAFNVIAVVSDVTIVLTVRARSEWRAMRVPACEWSSALAQLAASLATRQVRGQTF